MTIMVGILSFYGCGNDSGENVPITQDNKCIRENDCESGVCLATGYCATLVNEGDPCDDKYICRPGYQCAEGICIESDCQNGQCNPGPGTGCTDHSQCASGVCLESGACAKLVGEGEKCDKTRICEDKYSCVDGKCIGSTDNRECISDSDCANNRVCLNGHCVENPDICDPNYLIDDEDYDGDGIVNGIELNSNSECLDPCNPDSDGDGIADGIEDYNHNGHFDPTIGETDPCDPSSKFDPNSQAGILVKNTCKRDNIVSGITTGHYGRFELAKAKEIKYYPNLDLSDTNVIRFENDKVVGFFGSSADVIGTGQQLLLAVPDLGDYSENSVFLASVPLASWYKTDKSGKDIGYRDSLQGVPDHSVERSKYAIMTNGKSLQEIADALAKQFDPSSTAKYSGSIQCDRASLYLARSTYDRGIIYGGAITCDENLKVASVAALMDDVLSGTLIAPRRSVSEGASASGFYANNNFVCQIEDYGHSSSKADFLWIIDNSPSMADELENLNKTIQLFSTTMKAYGIDFRMGITTTDAYLLDEDPTAYRAYDDNYNIVLDSNTYLNGVGFKQSGTTLKAFRGFLDILSNDKLDNAKLTAFRQEIARNSRCTTDGRGGKNICGFGYQDGLKSGAFALSRINVDLDAAKAPDYYSEEDKANWDIIKKIKAGVTEGDAQKLAQVSLSPDENSRLYVIWFTDEESRQFKEKPAIVKPVNSTHINPVFEKSTGSVCTTGYKLENGKMRTGAGGSDLTEADCNPSMKDKLDQLVKAGMLSDDSSMEEIEAVYPEYADMLKYYIKQYQSFAQNREIVGFAFVGDVGRENGGFCKPLAYCSDENCIQKDTDGSCLECKNWEYNSIKATEGAEYGMSYIHMARFLSSYYPDDPDRATKEGGKASICATDYNATVTAIAEDLVGKLEPHKLWGYPIASSIRVYRVRNGKTVELQRNADNDGWAYDASQNAITFKNVQSMGSTDSIAITYAIWIPLEG